MFKKATTLIVLALVFVTLLPAKLFAAPSEEEIYRVYERAYNASYYGPDTVKLSNQASLDLIEDFMFIPQPHADRILALWGESRDSTMLGLILPMTDEDWTIIVSYCPEGYITDKDVDKMNPKSMLKDFQSGTKEANKLRREQGVPELEVLSWRLEPTYNQENKTLNYALLGNEIGNTNQDEYLVNYITYILGREGYIELNLVTSLHEFEQFLPLSSSLTNATTFYPGKSYEDFNPDTDKVAAYGLAALVAGGVAAKKVGLIAVLAKSSKLIIAGVIALCAAIAALFKRRKESPNTNGADIADTVESLSLRKVCTVR